MNAGFLLAAGVGMWIGTGCARAPKKSPDAVAEIRSAVDAVAPSLPTPEPATDAAPAHLQAPGWKTTPLPLGAGPVAVKQGSPPLAYLVESGGVFRVHDETDHKDLARAEALGRTIIRVDARAGVAVGRETLYAGPLPADHMYSIYLDPAGPNYSRRGVFQPRPAK